YDCARPVADARRSRRRYAGDEVRRRAPEPSPTGGGMAPPKRQAVSRRPSSPPWGRAWARSPCLPGEGTAPWAAAATHGPIGSTAPEPFQTSVRGGPAVPPPTRTSEGRTLMSIKTLSALAPRWRAFLLVTAAAVGLSALLTTGAAGQTVASQPMGPK